MNTFKKTILAVLLSSVSPLAFAATAPILSQASGGTGSGSGSADNMTVTAPNNATITLHDFVNETLDLRAAGAAGDGSDATTALNQLLGIVNARSTVSAKPTCIYIPEGSYTISGALTAVQNVDLCVRGAGSAKTILNFTSTGGGFSLSTTGANFLRFSGVRLMAQAANSGTGLTANWPTGGGGSAQQAAIDDVVMDFSGSGYWNNGMLFQNIDNAAIHGFDLHGPMPTNGVYPTQDCLKFAGTSIGDNLNAITCTGVDTGLDIRDGTQGVYASDFQFVEVGVGINSVHTTASGGPQPGYNFTNFHINARRTAINLYGAFDNQFSNGLIYAIGSATGNWRGISIDGDTPGYAAFRNSISNVEIDTLGATSLSSATHVYLGNAAWQNTLDVKLAADPSLTATTGAYCGTSALQNEVHIQAMAGFATGAVITNPAAPASSTCAVDYFDGANKVLANGATLNARNAAGTGSINLIGANAANQVVVGSGAPGILFGSIPALANNMFLQSVNAAGNGFVNLIEANPANQVVIGNGAPSILIQAPPVVGNSVGYYALNGAGNGFVNLIQANALNQVVIGSGANSVIMGGQVLPPSDNTTALGGAYRWSQVYSVNGKFDGQIQHGGSTPTATGTCSINGQTGGNTAGKFTANGACSSGTVVLSFAVAAPVGWACDAHDLTALTDLHEQTYTTSSVTLTGTMSSGDAVTFKCDSF